jgi:hypothetical protein
MKDYIYKTYHRRYQNLQNLQSYKTTYLSRISLKAAQTLRANKAAFDALPIDDQIIELNKKLKDARSKNAKSPEEIQKRQNKINLLIIEINALKNKDSSSSLPPAARPASSSSSSLPAARPASSSSSSLPPAARPASSSSSSLPPASAAATAENAVNSNIAPTKSEIASESAPTPAGVKTGLVQFVSGASSSSASSSSSPIKVIEIHSSDEDEVIEILSADEDEEENAIVSAPAKRSADVQLQSATQKKPSGS